MGSQIRDVYDKYVGAEGRYDDTKFMISPRTGSNHSHELVIRIWDTTFKPALKKECQRLGVQIFDRVMVTSLLTENGVQGGRVIGATGFNNRSGDGLAMAWKAGAELILMEKTIPLQLGTGYKHKMNHDNYHIHMLRYQVCNRLLRRP